MIQGTHEIRLDDIIVPENRWRPVDKKVKEIAESYKEWGQLQPIILRDLNNGKWELVDGLHRVTAARACQWESILAVFTDEVDPIRLREIELEVNIMRVEVSWQARELARAELHRMKEAADSTWTQRKTAEQTDSSQARVAQALKYADMVKLFPELAEAKSMKQALSWMKQKAKGILRVQEVADSVDLSTIEECILLGDSVELIKGFPDESINLVLTDPPFGIGYDTRKAGTEQSISSYEDSLESYERLLTMAPDLYRIIKRDGWLVWFLGASWFHKVSNVFEAVGFIVDPIPVVWDRSEGRSFTTRPDRYFARAYDMALHCIKGDPQMVIRGRPNVIHCKPLGQTERELLVERPVELYAEFIERLTVRNELVCDFFVGSGSVPAAAASLGRRYIGCEIDPIRRATAIKKIKAHSP